MKPETKQCRARWFTEVGTDYHAPPVEKECRELAHAEVDGVPLCWVHHATVQTGNATLGEVVRGERTPILERLIRMAQTREANRLARLVGT